MKNSAIGALPPHDDIRFDDLAGHHQIRPGFLADLQLVDGNPLADLANLQDQDRLLAIMKDGVFHKPPPASALKESAGASLG